MMPTFPTRHDEMEKKEKEKERFQLLQQVGMVEGGVQSDL